VQPPNQLSICSHFAPPPELTDKFPGGKRPLKQEHLVLRTTSQRVGWLPRALLTRPEIVKDDCHHLGMALKLTWSKNEASEI
jgi:hypothetical protein